MSIPLKKKLERELKTIKQLAYLNNNIKVPYKKCCKYNANIINDNEHIFTRVNYIKGVGV